MRARRKLAKMKLSLRSLLLCVSSFAIAMGVFAHVGNLSISSPQHEFQLGVLGLIMLLLIVCVTFASVADDVWQDPEATFVAGIFGVLGFTFIVIFGMLFPVVVW